MERCVEIRPQTPPQNRASQESGMIDRITALLLFIGLAFCQDITVAVYDFENNGLDDSQVRQITSRLESELEKAGFKFVERKQIDDLMKEQKFQISGVVDDDDLVEMGTMLGATHVLLGSVGKMSDTYYTITAKLVATGSGELEKSANYDAENGLSDLMKNGLRNLAKQLKETESDNSETAQYELSIGNVFIDERDFTRSGFGNPLNIKIVVWENREIVERINVGKVRGLEGINRKLQIKLKLNSVYKLFIGETDGVLTPNKVYEWNTTWEGVEKAKESDEWFFNKGKLKIGRSSYIEVTQYPPLPIDDTKYPIYRFLHKTINEHFYTKSSNPKGSWIAEGVEFYAYNEQVEGTVPIYRFLHNSYKDHFYTRNSNPDGNWKKQGVEFYAYPTSVEGTVPIYRYYSKSNRDHFYTTESSLEGDWIEQGIEFHAFPNIDK